MAYVRHGTLGQQDGQQKHRSQYMAYITLACSLSPFYVQTKTIVVKGCMKNNLLPLFEEPKAFADADMKGPHCFSAK